MPIGILHRGHSFLLKSILKIKGILSVDLLKHTFFAKEVQAIFDELRLHCDTHAEGALKSLDNPGHISDLLAPKAMRDSSHFSLHDKVDMVVDNIVCIVYQLV